MMEKIRLEITPAAGARSKLNGIEILIPPFGARSTVFYPCNKRIVLCDCLY